MPNLDDIAVMLKASDAFSDTPEKDLHALAELFIERHVSDGEIVIEEDALGHEVYLVLEGVFRVLTVEGDNADDKEKEIRILQKGDVFGEIAAMTGGRRMATVRAASDGLVLALSQDDFQSVLRNSPEMVESICNSLARYFEAE